MKEYTIDGVKVWLIGTRELVKIVHKSRKTLNKWEKKGALPKPFIEAKVNTGLGSFNKRLYTEGQIESLLEWMNKYRLFGKRSITEPMKEELRLRWRVEEKNFLEGVKNAKEKENKFQEEVRHLEDV